MHVALTGTTAAYDDTGRLLLWVDPDEQTSAVVDLTLTGERTPYALAGDWVLVLAALAIVAGLVAASLSSRPTPPDTGSPGANGTTQAETRTGGYAR